MAFIWMRQYPTVIHLAEMFGVDKATVSLEIHHVIPILRFHLQNEIVWMSMEEAQVLRGSWPMRFLPLMPLSILSGNLSFTNPGTIEETKKGIV